MCTLMVSISLPWCPGRSVLVPHCPCKVLCCSGTSGLVRRALQSRSRRPKRWLGQHYLVDDSVNDKIVEAAKIEAGDLVLEIGPGTGALTAALVRANARVIAVEKDADMAALVTERFQSSDQVEVILQDFLEWPVGNFMRNCLQQTPGSEKAPQQAKVVSNLPFNITSDVVKLLLPMGDLFSSIVLLLQDEAALRLVNALPKSAEYRAMSLLVNFFSKPEYKFPVKRTSFYPTPNVDAGLVCFQVKRAFEYPPVSSPRAFFSLVNSAFNSKRKMLRTSLQHLYSSSEIQDALFSVGLSKTSRPEELSLEQFVALFNACEATRERSQETNRALSD